MNKNLNRQRNFFRVIDHPEDQEVQDSSRVLKSQVYSETDCEDGKECEEEGGDHCGISSKHHPFDEDLKEVAGSLFSQARSNSIVSLTPHLIDSSS